MVFDIGEYCKFMYLDIVFIMIDYDKFMIYLEIEGGLVVYLIIEKVDGDI